MDNPETLATLRPQGTQNLTKSERLKIHLSEALNRKGLIIQRQSIKKNRQWSTKHCTKNELKIEPTKITPLNLGV
jgi:hypothetical protein